MVCWKITQACTIHIVPSEHGDSLNVKFISISQRECWYYMVLHMYDDVCTSPIIFRDITGLKIGDLQNPPKSNRFITGNRKILLT